MSSKNSDNVVDAIPLQDRVQVDREFHALIQPATSQELAQLETNLLTEGCRDALVTWQGLLLDGHNRLEICRRLGLAFRTVEIDLANRDAAKMWIIANQLARRNLTPFQRAELVLKLEPLIARQAKQKQRDSGGAVIQRSGQPPVKTDVELARMAGVSHDTIHKAKVVATKAPESVKAALRRGDGHVKLNQAYQAVRAEERRSRKMQELRSKAGAGTSDAASPPSSSPPSSVWSIVTGDCIEQLQKQPAGSARLIFADPPYNIGIDYGDGHYDRRSDGDYLAWVAAWLAECRRVLADDGSLWVLICDEYAAEYALSLKRLGLTLRNWIKWYETFGVNCTSKFNRTSRHLLYTVKDPKRLVFHPEPVTRPSDRQDKYGDKRASPGGKLWDDVWQIPRLVGTGSERLPEFPTQLPLKLLEPIVLCGTDPGDLVIDPFNGSGTTGEAAIRHGRRYLGIERSEKYAELSRLRLQGAKP
mgnify:FL=1